MIEKEKERAMFMCGSLINLSANTCVSSFEGEGRIDAYSYLSRDMCVLFFCSVRCCIISLVCSGGGSSAEREQRTILKNFTCLDATHMIFS